MSWGTDYRFPGTWRGLPFFVSAGTKSLGRRVVTHIYPLVDQPYHEDLGASPQKFELEVFLIGDDVLDQITAFEAALLQGGVGELVHPWYGSLQVVVTEEQSVAWAIATDRLASATLRFELDASPALQSKPEAETDTADATVDAADSADSAVAADATTSLDIGGVLGGALGFVAADAAAAAGALGDALSGALSAVGAVSALATGVVSDALGVVADAQGLVSGVLATALDPAAALVGAITAPLQVLPGLLPMPPLSALAAAVPLPAPLGGALAAAGDALGAVQGTIGAAVTLPASLGLPMLSATLTLAGAAPSDGAAPTPLAPSLVAALTAGVVAASGPVSGLPVSGGVTAPGRAAQAANRAIIAALGQATAATAAARIAVRIAWSYRQQVDAAAARLAAALDAASDAVGALGWDASWRALTDLKAGVATHLAVTAQPLQSLAVVTVTRTVPAAVLAYRLYGDTPGRVLAMAGDIVMRNRVSQPSFVPVGTLEVLAPRAGA